MYHDVRHEARYADERYFADSAFLLDYLIKDKEDQVAEGPSFCPLLLRKTRWNERYIADSAFLLDYIIKDKEDQSWNFLEKSMGAPSRNRVIVPARQTT
jgi:hypothetical protein